MKAPQQDSKPRQLCPPGVQPARCVWLIDIGTQLYKPTGQSQRKLIIGFETPNARADFGKGSQPFLIKRTFAFCMTARNKKTKLREFIEGWRGKPYATDEDASDMDFSRLVGAAAIIVVQHKQSASGTVFEDIAAITPCPKAECAPQVNASIMYSIEDGMGGAYGKLPEWLQKQINESKEFTDPSTPAEASGATSGAEQAAGDGGAVPF